MAASVSTNDPIRWEIEWTVPASQSTSSAAAYTEARLTLQIGDDFIWPGTGFAWTWIEMLEWLGESWPWLCGEDGLPFSTDPATTDDLRRWVDQQYRLAAVSERDRAELALWDFLSVHDLSHALKGAQSAPIVVWREGLLGHILTATGHTTGPWAPVKSSLEGLGNEINARLEPLSDDARARVARETWERRNAPSMQDLLSVAAVPDLLADRVASALSAEKGKGSAGAQWLSIERNEILAAARMTASLPHSVTSAILDRILALPKASTAQIDTVAERVAGTAEIPPDAQPYEEGYAYAEAFRRVLGLSDGEAFVPKSWLTAAGIQYEEVDLQTSLIDAVAAWGEVHGPAVVVNTSGKHSQSARGKNASIAHEIGHLLLDREGALSAVEILGGRVNPRIESRVRAFAAELLLPRAIAGRVLAEAGDVDSAARFVRSLTARYGVSNEVVAWQARNSGEWMQDRVTDHLRGLVHDPQRF